MKKILSKLATLNFWVICLLLALSLVFLLPITPVFASAYNLVIIRSGSMEPAIATGSLAITMTGEYSVGDVIAFPHPSGNGKVVALHRIVEEVLAENTFRTKGDANSDNDLFEVAANSVQGRVVAVVPLVGFWLQWLQTDAGLAISVGFPVLFLVGHSWQSLKANSSLRKLW